MKYNYINKIKQNLKIYSSVKSTNLLDGTYKSIYKGKSFDFNNLRNYVINDDIKDIDWKSSVKNGEILVKQFTSLKKHNILLVLDSGIKMLADTDKLENKKEISMLIAGTIGYIALSNNDLVSIAFESEKKIIYKPYSFSISNLEQYLYEFDNYSKKSDSNLNNLLHHILKYNYKKSIIFIITDDIGIKKISDNTLKKLKILHDIQIITINDNFMINNDVFDIESNTYISPFFLKNKKLYLLERNIRKNLQNDNKKRLNKLQITITNISSKKEINSKLINHMEEHKYASIKRT